MNFLILHTSTCSRTLYLTNRMFIVFILAHQETLSRIFTSCSYITFHNTYVRVSMENNSYVVTFNDIE